MDVDRLIDRLLKIESLYAGATTTALQTEAVRPATTIMLKVKRSFLDETFLPQFNVLHEEMTKHVDEVAKTIIETAVHRDLTNAPEMVEPKQLSMSVGG